MLTHTQNDWDHARYVSRTNGERGEHLIPLSEESGSVSMRIVDRHFVNNGIYITYNDPDTKRGVRTDHISSHGEILFSHAA